MTREELDARAAKLGISTSSRWKDETVAEKIAERGHFICPYSHATKGNIEVETEVV